MPYNPAQRKKAFQARYRVSKARRAWAKVSWGTVAMMKYENTEELHQAEDEEGVQRTRMTESGPTVRLVVSKNGRGRPTTLDLTMLTEADLRAVHEVMELAFQHALKSCIERDQEAKDAHAKGDDSFVRLYRPVPELVVREGTEREYDPRIWNRPPNVSGSNGSSGGERLRAEGDGVAQPAPSGRREGERQDDESEAD